MKEERVDRLYNLLPSVYRMRDAELGQPLRALLRVIAEQVNLVAGNEPQPIKVVPQLFQLAQRGVECPRLRHQKCVGDAVELTGCVVLKLTICGDFALQVDELRVAAVGFAQRLKADDTDEGQQSRNTEKRGQELDVDARRYVRDESRQ